MNSLINPYKKNALIPNLYLHRSTQTFLRAKESISGGLSVYVYDLSGNLLGTKNFFYEELLQKEQILPVSAEDVKNISVASPLGYLLVNKK